MYRLIPADELPNTFLDADRGVVPQRALGAPQVRRGKPHVTRLVAVALDPDLPPQRPPDQLDQPVEAHARPATDVDRLGEPLRPRPGGPFYGGEDAVHAIRNIGIVALARPGPVHRAASSTRTVPVTLVSPYEAGSSREGRTPGRAARCRTTDTPSSGRTSRTMSASTKWKPPARRSPSRFRSFTARG